MDHGTQRHIDTHWTDLCADGEAIIKGINQQNVSVKMRNAPISARPAFNTAHMKHTLTAHVHIHFTDVKSV